VRGILCSRTARTKAISSSSVSLWVLNDTCNAMIALSWSYSMYFWVLLARVSWIMDRHAVVYFDLELYLRHLLLPSVCPITVCISPTQRTPLVDMENPSLGLPLSHIAFVCKIVCGCHEKILLPDMETLFFSIRHPIQECYLCSWTCGSGILPLKPGIRAS